MICVLELQVLAATTSELQLATQRLNIRYFTTLTTDATEGITPTAADERAASVRYVFDAASSRRSLSSSSVKDTQEMHAEQNISLEPVQLLSSLSESLEKRVLAVEGSACNGLTSCSALDLSDLHQRLEDHKSQRKLLQTTSATYVNTSDTAFLWMDLNGDGIVNIQDSLLFADVIKLVDSDSTAHCTWIESVYFPSNASQPHSLVRGNSFTDASITGVGSSGWQAMDPKLIYLRSNDSDVMYLESTSCTATVSGTALSVPHLARFDGSTPLNQQEFLAIVPGAETSDPAGLFKAFLRPDEARDWRMYTVSSLCFLCFTISLRIS